MGSYADVEFHSIADSGGVYRNVWERASNVSERHIPYGDTDDVQGGGLGDWTITIRANVPNEERLDALFNMQGAELRVLQALFFDGDDYAEVALTKVDKAKRTNLSVGCWCDLTFVRQAAAGDGTPTGGAPVSTAPLQALVIYNNVGLDVEFDPNYSTSPDGTIDAVHYEFGDGSIFAAPGGTTGGGMDTTTHGYAEAGTYFVNVSVDRGVDQSINYALVVVVTG